MKLEDMTLKQVKKYCFTQGCDDCGIKEFCDEHLMVNPRDWNLVDFTKVALPEVPCTTKGWRPKEISLDIGDREFYEFGRWYDRTKSGEKVNPKIRIGLHETGIIHLELWHEGSILKHYDITEEMTAYVCKVKAMKEVQNES